MNRKNFDLNAGSMADIAFLLLIFFLVSTTIEKDKGYLRNLPAKVEGTKNRSVPDRDVFFIHLNNDNQLMVEGSASDHEMLKQELRKFYLSNSPMGKASNLHPSWIKSEKYPQYQCLDSSAVIKIDAELKTEYGPYVEIQSDIQDVVHEIRNELAFHYFGTSYDYLIEHKEKEFEKIHILKSLAPIRIIDSKVD